MLVQVANPGAGILGPGNGPARHFRGLSPTCYQGPPKSAGRYPRPAIKLSNGPQIRPRAQPGKAKRWRRRLGHLRTVQACLFTKAIISSLKIKREAQCLSLLTPGIIT